MQSSRRRRRRRRLFRPTLHPYRLPSTTPLSQTEHQTPHVPPTLSHPSIAPANPRSAVCHPLHHNTDTSTASATRRVTSRRQALRVLRAEQRRAEQRTRKPDLRMRDYSSPAPPLALALALVQFRERRTQRCTVHCPPLTAHPPKTQDGRTPSRLSGLGRCWAWQTGWCT